MIRWCRLSLFTFIIFSANIGSALDWSKEALKLTGESDKARDQALKNLKREKKIKKTLKTELKGKKKSLALDVISALQYRGFIPQLLELAPNDETGAMYLTINTLLTPKNALKVIATYRERVGTETHPASIVVLLDTLGAIGSPLPQAQLEELLKNESFEVRSAVVSYVRSLVLRHKKKQYAVLLKKVLQTSPLQLRVQGIFLASELGKNYAGLKSDLKNICLKDYNKNVLEVCQERLKGI
jgi:hypothetical protein